MTQKSLAPSRRRFLLAASSALGLGGLGFMALKGGFSRADETAMTVTPAATGGSTARIRIVTGGGVRLTAGSVPGVVTGARGAASPVGWGLFGASDTSRADEP